MSKFFKIVLITILLCFCINSVFATNSVNSTSQQTTTVTTIDNIPESGLGLSNILNILLITVGIVIIFLAIAILIRLK